MTYAPRRALSASLIALALSVCSMPASAQFDWRAAIDQMINDLLHAPIPDAIAPLVTIAENGDELTVDGLTIILNEKRKRILLDMADNPTDTQLDKQLKAIEELIAKSREVKDKIAPPHKEQGLDPFYGRMYAPGPVTLPGAGQSVAVNLQLNLDDSQGLGPIAHMVLPGPNGAVGLSVVPTGASASLSLSASASPGRYQIHLSSFTYTLPSFNMGGAPTGVSTMQLTTALGAPLGVLNMVDGAQAGVFKLRFAAGLSNSLYGPSGTLGGTIPVLVQAQGVFDPTTGQAVITAEDPMMLPGVPGYAPNSPMMVAPTMAHFDASQRAITFHDAMFDAEAGLDSGAAPTVMLIRRANNSYETIFDHTDPIVGASLAIGPLVIDSEIDGVIRFLDTTLTLQNADGLLLQASIEGISLIIATGQFEGVLNPDAPGAFVDAASSPFLQEWLTHNRRFQLLSPQAAGELYLASGGFTQNAQSAMPDFVNGGTPPVPEPGTVALLVAGLAVVGWRQRHRIRQQDMPITAPVKS